MSEGELKLDVRWLEDLICLNEAKSFSVAATRRYVTQSSLSRRIRHLEDWAGVELVDRSSCPITLTSAGKSMLRDAQVVVKTLRAVKGSMATV